MSIRILRHTSYIIHSFLLLSCTQLEVSKEQAALKISASSGLSVGKKQWPSCSMGWNTSGTFAAEQSDAVDAAFKELNNAKLYVKFQKNTNALLKVAFATPEQIGKNNSEGLLTYRQPALAAIEGNVSRGYTIYLNQTHTWNAAQLKAVVMNQLGEIMGLPPSTNKSSVMYALLVPASPTTQWSQEDIKALRQLYPESGLPLVTTGQVSLSPTTKSHAIEATVTNADNVPVLSNVGVIWSSTNPMPTIDNFEGRVANGNGAKSLNVSLWELKMGTSYYLRAYASNACGTNYGAVVNFTKP